MQLFHATVIALQQIPSVEVPGILSEVSLRTVLKSLFLLAVAYLVIRLTDLVLRGLANRVPRSRFLFKMLVPVVRFGLWLGVSLYILLRVLAPTPETALAVLASVGIALGLGAQDLVKNLIGGLVILIDRPYQVGDRVKIGDAYGEVQQIGLRSTKLVTPDDTRVTIPNSEILTGAAWNANSGLLTCQVVTDLYLPHSSDPNACLTIGREAAYSSPYVLTDRPVVVLLQDGFNDSPYLLVRIKCYVYDHCFEPLLKSDITARAKTEFLRQGILKWGQNTHKSRH